MAEPAARAAHPFPDVIALEPPRDFDDWRALARHLVLADIAPDRVLWSHGSDLLARRVDPATRPAVHDAGLRVPQRFLSFAEKAFLHADAARHALLYRILWRLQSRPNLLADAADDDVARLADLERAVRRDMHKMRAFVRFRAVRDADGRDTYVAWFEPQHHILRANAAFFVGRFASMRWSILTPQGSLHWDGDALLEGPPARREDAPARDDAEDLWRTYYASIFNPARLKIGAMLKEMPKRYWKNMPEAALIPALVAGAQAREAAMIARGSDSAADSPQPASLDEIADRILACRRCPIGCNGTRAVAGEGPPRAALMIIGEQPGDCEEMAGRPFVGPAGALLNDMLADAGIDRAQAYVTNAVKHFKYEPQGKRRLHQNPSASEIDHCRWWLDRERQLVQPRLILSLGASALRGLTGRTQSITRVRGTPVVLSDGSECWPTIHPSYLLRLDGAARARETALFAADLSAVAERLAMCDV